MKPHDGHLYLSLHSVMTATPELHSVSALPHVSPLHAFHLFMDGVEYIVEPPGMPLLALLPWRVFKMKFPWLTMDVIFSFLTNPSILISLYISCLHRASHSPLSKHMAVRRRGIVEI